MTHLSDYSYLDRLVANLVIFPFLLYYVFCLKHGGRAFKKDLREWQNGRALRLIIFLMYCLSYVCGITYDICQRS